MIKFIISFLLLSSNIISAHNQDSDWIWLPDSNHSICNGYYQPFDFSNWQHKKSTEITADHLIHQTNHTQFLGHVELYSEQQLLRADQLILKHDMLQNPNTAIAQNKVQYYRPNFYLSSKQAKYNFLNKSFKIDHGCYRFYPRHARGQAQSVCIFDKKNLELQKGTYTTCAPNNNTWLLQTHSLSLDIDHNRGTAHHVTLRCKNIPIFYWPYFQFPLDNKTRLSGFLAPSYYKHPSLGYGLILPYYWNIAPNFDTTIYLKPHPHNRIQLEQEIRYLLPYLSGDLKYELSPDHPDSSHRKTRASLHTHHQFDSGDHWSGQFNLQYVNDPRYYTDFSTQFEQENLRYLPRHTSLNYAQSNFKFSSQVLTHQVLSPIANFPTPDIYSLKPALQLQQFETLLVGSILASQFFQWTHFEKQTTSTNNPHAHRLIWQPRLHRRFQFPGGFFDPSLAARISHYQVSNAESKLQNITQTCPIINLETGLFFEKYSAQSSYSPIQTLEPKIFYCWIPKAQNKSPIIFDSHPYDIPYIAHAFQPYQYSGYDQLDTANQITVGFTTRWIDPIQQSEWADLSISQIYDFKKHSRYPNHRSSIYLESNVSLSLQNPKFWKLHSGFAWSPCTKQTDYFSFTSQWELFSSIYSDENFNCEPCVSRHRSILSKPIFQTYPILIYTSYLYHKETQLQQGILGGAIPIHNRWRILGQCHYNFNTNHCVQVLSGLEWENCCLSIRFVMTGYFQPHPTPSHKTTLQRQYFLQIQFKGLTMLGQKEVDRTIKNHLPGYEWLQNRY